MSEFPSAEVQTVEVSSKNKQESQHKEAASLASERRIEDKKAHKLFQQEFGEKSRRKNY